MTFMSSSPQRPAWIVGATSWGIPVIDEKSLAKFLYENAKPETFSHETPSAMAERVIASMDAVPATWPGRVSRASWPVHRMALARVTTGLRQCCERVAKTLPGSQARVDAILEALKLTQAVIDARASRETRSGFIALMEYMRDYQPDPAPPRPGPCCAPPPADITRKTQSFFRSLHTDIRDYEDPLKHI